MHQIKIDMELSEICNVVYKAGWFISNDLNNWEQNQHTNHNSF